MSLSRDSLQKKLLKAIRRAQFGLKQRIQRIHWEENELFPELADLDAGRTVLGLDAGTAFDIQIEREGDENTRS